MKATIRRIGTVSAVTLAAAVLLTGCLEDETTTPADDAAVADTATVEIAAEVTGQSCLPGSWTVHNDTFEAAMLKMVKENPEMPADMKANMTITITGESSIRFDGTDVYGAWQDAATMTMVARGSTIRHVQDSSTLGSYGANDDFVWVSNVQILDLRATMTVDGLATVTLDSSSPGMASVDMFGWSGDVPGVNLDLADGVAAYECTGDTLILVADGELRTELSRLPE